MSSDQGRTRPANDMTDTGFGSNEAVIDSLSRLWEERRAWCVSGDRKKKRGPSVGRLQALVNREAATAAEKFPTSHARWLPTAQRAVLRPLLGRGLRLDGCSSA
jgi:hypothetical protein